MKFVHVYDPKSPRPGVTIAYEIAETSENKIVSLGASFSSPEDTYSKVRGRSISGQRLKSQPLRFLLEKEGDVMARHLISILHTFVQGTDYDTDTQPLRPSRFEYRCLGNLIGPGGHLIRVEFDANAHSIGWMNRVPRWVKKFLGDPP